jgi:cephalosporin hydroxylase
VLENVRYYHKYVTPGSYLLIQDSKITRWLLSSDHCKNYPDQDCGKLGPRHATEHFLKEQGGKFVADRSWEYLRYTQHAGGFLKRVS